MQVQHSIVQRWTEVCQGHVQAAEPYVTRRPIGPRQIDALASVAPRSISQSVRLCIPKRIWMLSKLLKMAHVGFFRLCIHRKRRRKQLSSPRTLRICVVAEWDS